DLVLARAAASEDGDAQPLCHGVVMVVVSVVVVSVGGGGGGVGGGGGGGGGGCWTRRPTVSVTVVFAVACVPPFGLWPSTIPSWVGSDVSCGTTWTLNPLACRSLAA